MDITHATKGGVLVIKPNTMRLDAKDAPKFKEDVLKLISTNTKHNVVFDLGAISFIDSSGIGTLLAILRVLSPSGGELKLADVKPSIRNVFELISMDKIFEIYKTTDEAITSFEKQHSNSQDDTKHNGRTPSDKNHTK